MDKDFFENQVQTKGHIVISMKGGLIESIHSTDPNIGVKIFNWDIEDEEFAPSKENYTQAIKGTWEVA